MVFLKMNQKGDFQNKSFQKLSTLFEGNFSDMICIIISENLCFLFYM